MVINQASTEEIFVVHSQNRLHTFNETLQQVAWPIHHIHDDWPMGSLCQKRTALRNYFAKITWYFYMLQENKLHGWQEEATFAIDRFSEPSNIY